MSRMRNGWILPISLVLALLLGLLPLPEIVQPLRPFWLALVLSYWVIETPERAGLGFALFIGVIADLMFGSVLGEHALRLIIMTFILQRFRLRLRFFPVSQQALAMGGLLLNDLIVDSAIRWMLGMHLLPAMTWWSPLLGMLLWPLVYLLLDVLRQGRRG